MRVLFANLPWWQEEEGKPLRKGVRAGSRWPHTNEAPHKPDKWRLGSYAPFPFFMGYAASYLQKARPEFEVVVRDSVARGESYETFLQYVHDFHPAFVIVESAAPSWAHDSDLIHQMIDELTYSKIIVTGPQGSGDMSGQGFYAWISGEYEKGVARALAGHRGGISHDFLTLSEMNDAPFPMFDEEAALHYWDGNPKGNVAPQLQVWGSRGCFAKCLAGDTPVNTINGLIPIKDLVGKETGVFTYDPATKNAMVCTGRNVAKYGTSRLVRVMFDDGTHIDCTPDHKFLTFKWGNQYVGETEQECEACDLSPGQHVRALNSFKDGIENHRVVSVEQLPGLHPVFCLTIPETGWFYANNVLVKNCSFCVWPAVMTGNDPDGTKTRLVRLYRPDRIEAFIRHRLAINPGIKSIYFDDDTFNLSNAHVLGVNEVMKRIGLPWTAMCRADTIREDVWVNMATSGCKGVKLGFESGSQRVLDQVINKRLDLGKAVETAKFIRRHGMSVHGTFTIGLPGETQEEAQQTVDLIKRMYDEGGLDTHQLSKTAEIAGTPLANIPEDGGTLAAYPGAVKDVAYKPVLDGNTNL